MTEIKRTGWTKYWWGWGTRGILTYYWWDYEMVFLLWKTGRFFIKSTYLHFKMNTFLEDNFKWLLLFVCLHLFSPPQLHFKWEAGMNMSPVSRLKKTWAKVKTAKFDVLEVCEADASLLTFTPRKWNSSLRACLLIREYYREESPPTLTDTGNGRGLELVEGRISQVVDRPFRRQRRPFWGELTEEMVTCQLHPVMCQDGIWILNH